MKSLKIYGLFLLLYFVIPILIGEGVGFLMHEIYLNFNKHILALIGVCFISGAVVAWLPMLMVFSLDDKLDFSDKLSLWAIIPVLWIAGIVLPLIFGFVNDSAIDLRYSGGIIGIILVFVAFYTPARLMTSIFNRLEQIKKDLEENNS